MYTVGTVPTVLENGQFGKMLNSYRLSLVMTFLCVL